MASGETASKDFLPGFSRDRIPVAPGVAIAVRHAGSGPPVLLLHGHPQTLSTWTEIAPRLAARHTVVCADLRGYGDSDKPPSAPDHAPYAKRTMAQDQVAVMRALGYERFAVVGHDRGARVAHRMALDHPQAVTRLAVLDIAPTLAMYERTDMEFARRYFWWFFLIQPHPLPERMIGADPGFYLAHHLAGQSKTPGVPRADLAAEYLRAYDDPAGIHAICEDYRAAASIDLEHDRADIAAGRRIRVPLLALWGAKGTVGALYDVPALWREVAEDVRGAALNCGHLLQEEAPEALLAQLEPFLSEPVEEG